MISLSDFFKQWCKETGRSCGVLVGGYIREFLSWLETKIEIKTQNNG